MRAIMISRWMLLGFALLATAGVAGCAAGQAPGNTAPGNGQTTTSAASPAPAQTISKPAGTPSATPAGTHTATPTVPRGIRNLVISSAERSKLTEAFVARKGISPSDVYRGGPLPGSVYYAYDPATGTHWALASFEPSSTAPLNVKVNFQDGGNIGMFQKAGAGPWQVRTPGWPPICSEPRFFPQAVLTAWGLPASAPPGTGC